MLENLEESVWAFQGVLLYQLYKGHKDLNKTYLFTFCSKTSVNRPVYFYDTIEEVKEKYFTLFL